MAAINTVDEGIEMADTQPHAQVENAASPAPPPKLGLSRTPLYETTHPDENTVDIIAIHGLDTHSSRTFEAWKNGRDESDGVVNWLRDPLMLPRKIPNSRILTYDWPAGVDDSRTATASIFQQCRSFLLQLQIRREQEVKHGTEIVQPMTSQRPIIFIASCFGGILLAKALVESAVNEEFQDIARLTVGVAFLGTPFQGTDQNLHAVTMLRIRDAIQSGQPSNVQLGKLLDERHDRSELDELVSKFSELMEQPKHKFPVACFCETAPTNLLRVWQRLDQYDGNVPLVREHEAVVLVPSHSAGFRGIVPIALLGVKHTMLAKFKDDDDQNFEIVCRYLVGFATGATRVMDAKRTFYKPQENITKVALWLSEDGSQAEQEDFYSRARDGTADWFLDSDDFKLWLKKDSEINVLFCPGISGAGKTVMASVVVHELLRLFGGHEEIKVAFVFCRGRNQKHSKADSLLRLILRQLIQEFQIVPKELQDLYDQADKSLAQPSPEKLKQTISSVIESRRLDVFFVVDGVDELDVHERRVLLEHLLHLQRRHNSRLLATAQPVPDIVERFCRERRDTQWREVSPTPDAIRSYVAGEVNNVVENEVAENTELVEDIKNTIAQAADGMFLLAQLYLIGLGGLPTIEVHEHLKLLKRQGSVTAGADASVITLMITEAYEKVVTRMSRQVASLTALAMRILARMIFSYRPLALDELQDALLDPASSNFHLYSRSEHLESFNARRIAQACAGFVVVEQSNNSVRLIHATAQKFLENNLYRLNGNSAGIIDSPEKQGIDAHKVAEHKAIALGCVAYLSQDGLKTNVDSMEGWKYRLSDFPFYEYAAEYWQQHVHAGNAEQCEPILSFRRDEACMASVGPIILPPRGGYVENGEEGCRAGQCCWLNRKLPQAYEKVLPKVCSWVSDCDGVDPAAEHTRCRRGTIPHMNQPLRFIDLESMCIVTAVRARGLSYAALSYCWGEVGMDVRLSPASLATLTRSHGLCDTLQDALSAGTPPATLDLLDHTLALCRSLSHRYVWIDTCCIVLDDAEDWLRQVPLMGDIYGNARLVIAAAASSNSHDGLLSLDQDGYTNKHAVLASRLFSTLARAVLEYLKRILRLSWPFGMATLFRAARSASSAHRVWFIAVAMLERLKAVLRPPAQQQPGLDALFRTAVSQSHWASRAWTLQEYVLPSRLLIFTKQGPFFSCESRLYGMDGWVSGIRPGRPLSLHNVECGYQLEAYLEIVQEYNTRSATLEKDFEFALNGIASPLVASMDGRPNSFLAGVPTCAIDKLLAWRVLQHDPSSRRRALPSWSWYGWRQRPLFPPIVMDEARRHREEMEHGITTCKYPYRMILNTPQGHEIEPLRLQTSVGQLNIETSAESTESFESTSGYFEVRDLKHKALVGKIQLTRGWRKVYRYGPTYRTHFIPILTISDPENKPKVRIKMLMFIIHSPYDIANLWERVQIMDCDMSEDDWYHIVDQLDPCETEFSSRICEILLC